jgi:N-acetylmuramoyl-L-alanine amidase
MRRFPGFLLAALALAALTPHPVPAAPAEGQVVAVSLVPSPGRAELVDNVRGSVSVRDFVLSSPSRIVLDISGATLTTPAEPIYDGVSRAGVLNVRIRQYTPEIVRVVLDMGTGPTRWNGRMAPSGFCSGPTRRSWPGPPAPRPPRGHSRLPWMMP